MSSLQKFSCGRRMGMHLDDAGDVLFVVLQDRAVRLLRHADVVEGIQALREIRQEPAHASI